MENWKNLTAFVRCINNVLMICFTYQPTFQVSLVSRCDQFLWTSLFTLHPCCKESKTFHKLTGGDYVTFVCARIKRNQCCATHRRIWWSLLWRTGRDIIVLKNLCLLFLLLVDKIGMKHLSDIHYYTAFHRCLAYIYANNRKQTAWE